MAHLELRTTHLSDGQAFTLRTAEPGDAAALTEHRHKVRGTSDHLVTQPDEDEPSENEQRESIAKALASPVKLLIVGELADDPGRIVAELGFHGHDRRRMAHHGDFGIDVDSELRGLGIGQLLITALLDWAAAHETLEKVSLGVMETNKRARKLYRSLGFVKECRQRQFFRLAPGQYVDDIVMSQYVKPGVAPEGFNTWAPKTVESADT